MYVERELNIRFKKLLQIYRIIAVVGPRQSGKTTFLKAHLPENAGHLLFDDPDIRMIFDDDIKKFEQQYIEGKELVILDEVQYANSPGQKLKYLADVGRKIWITSSSEILLSKNVLAFLVGRVSILRLYPFSITEFLKAKNINITTRQIIEREIEEHIRYGGYPKVVITSDVELKKIILKDLYETMILKDIARAFSISDINSLEKFTEYLAINNSGQLSYDSIAQTIKISFQTIKKYLDAMEKSYFITVIRPFFTNKNKELSKQPKIYMLDTGLRNIIVKNFDVDGKNFENYVLTELIKSGYTPKYWRTKTKTEVDFIIERDNKIIPIEVKLTETKTGKGLRSFIEKYKPERAYIVILKGENKTLRANGCKIKFINVIELKKEI
ncbi:TPA: ATP-binding protein [Candidatus Woesearchaeota archaeon]|nr:ATP-binding protein [Candidatus Woesearchaeota archaeon]HIH32492.1 ATP-binding protein [Candidatus Woesearchaeota archaeon]HIJ14446.1 ATP-binding protein [Candidatus Woesearchaeota archaeon]